MASTYIPNRQTLLVYKLQNNADGTSEKIATITIPGAHGPTYIDKKFKYDAEGNTTDDRTEISAGAMYVGMNEKGNMDLSYNMGGGLTISASSNRETGMSNMKASFQMFALMDNKAY